LVLPVWDGVEAPPDLPPAEALRGQVCRRAPEMANTPVD
jgi:hypothetical protein